MIKQTTLSLFCLLIATLSNKVYAQTSSDSLAHRVTAYNNTISKFNENIGPQSRLYNGEEYFANYPLVTGSPYFSDSDNWGIGNIVYDGYSYSNIKMKYDIVKDVLVIMLYQSELTISLLGDKLTSFDVFGHHFIYIKNNPAAINAVKPGIYEELYGGKTLVLKKWDRSIQQDHSLAAIGTYFSTAIDYYVYNNNAYFSANSKGEFLDALKDKKQNVQQFIRANKIKFKKDTKETAMARVAAYYDQISQ